MHALRLPALLAVLLALFLAACGGGGAVDLAPPSISGRVIVVQDPTQPTVTTTYTFSSSTYTATGGDSGTYNYSKIGGTTTKANLLITSSFTTPSSYVLTFTSTGGGTYVDNNTSATSTFTFH